MSKSAIITILFTSLFTVGCGEDARGTIFSGVSSDGATDSSSDSDSNGFPYGTDASADSDTSAVDDSDTTETIYITPNDQNNEFRKDYLHCTYRTIEEDETTFRGEIVIGNANEDYVWNGYAFTAWGVSFITTSEITLVGLDQWNVVDYSQQNDRLYIDLSDDSLFPAEFLNAREAPLNSPAATPSLVTMIVEGKKNGLFPYPTRCMPDYIRGDIVYPVYQDLPHSWWKGKAGVKAADLMHDEADYYKEAVAPTEEGVFIYHPKHDTQITIGQPHGVGRTINGFDNLYIRIPNKMMAMAVGFNYEWFKFNPNYFCALGTKENYACGFAALDDPQAGAGGRVVNIGGTDYNWYIVLPSVDGPFQQEEPNFIGVARIFPDYYTSEHDYEKYVYVPDTPNDPQWASATISSALSSVATRETLWAFQKGKYGRIVFEAIDPMAELAVITFTYNRGIGAFCGTGVMGNLDAYVASTDTVNEFGLIGHAEHVPSVKAIVMAMNAETGNVYDAPLTWTDIADFTAVIRKYYDRGYPTDAQWQVMLSDMKNAHDALAQHWGGDHIRYRYDFLTILRVMKQHLNKPTIPRPTTDYWRFLIDGGWLAACAI